MLAASCGKDMDVDDSASGVKFDATRLKECLGRNQDVVSAKCPRPIIRRRSAPSSSALPRASRW